MGSNLIGSTGRISGNFSTGGGGCIIFSKTISISNGISIGFLLICTFIIINKCRIVDKIINHFKSID